MIARTPLYPAHLRLGGKMTEFGGWEMPLYYTSIMDEHRAVRQTAGLFDISHMGEFMVQGAGAVRFLNHALTNDAARLQPGQGQYTLMCNELGGIFDDLYLYCLAVDKYLLIVNASRIAADFSHLQGLQAKFADEAEVELLDASAETGALAAQGGAVALFIDQCFKGPSAEGTAVNTPSGLKKNQVAAFAESGGRCWVARTGYTGEDGFEIVAPADRVAAIWERLLTLGASHGLKPAGLGARDTLRTEMCYPLYGHELTESTTPVEAGLSFFVDLNKGAFMGGETLRRQKTEGPERKLVAFKMSGKTAPPRVGYPILARTPASEKIGETTSGTLSPSLGIGIGLGYVGSEFARPGLPIDIEIRGRRVPAEVSPKPLYRKPN